MNLQRRVVLVSSLVLALAACSTVSVNQAPADQPRAGSVLGTGQLDPALAARIMSLDPEHVSAKDVRETLALGPTPRIVLLHGGIYPVHLVMENFAEFLVEMGYPENRIRDPGTGALTSSPYDDSERQAGTVAWYYEHDGVRPELIGHSQGGIQAVKILHELAGSFTPTVRVFNPVAGEFEERTTIRDPLSGRERPVTSLSVAYTSVVGTGGWSLALPNHWIVAGRIREIPNSVDEFTGYRLGVDFFAWDGPGLEAVKTFYTDGKARVRNVTLPAEYSHVLVPMTAQLAQREDMRNWLNAYDPTRKATPPPGDAMNVMYAADVWHSVKRHWVLEEQRFVQAQRANYATGRESPRASLMP